MAIYHILGNAWHEKPALIGGFRLLTEIPDATRYTARESVRGICKISERRCGVAQRGGGGREMCHIRIVAVDTIFEKKERLFTLAKLAINIVQRAGIFME